MTTLPVRAGAPHAAMCGFLPRWSGLALGLLLGFGSLDSSAKAEPPGTNYDESRVGQYTLPDPLVNLDGKKITTAEAWRIQRRPELLRLFETQMFGRVPTPPHPITPRFRPAAEDAVALDGKAIRRQVDIRFGDDPSGPVIHVLIYLPRTAAAGHRVPAFLGLNFYGNHTVSMDPGVPLAIQRRREGRPVTAEAPAPESSRGNEDSRWSVAKVVARGYALATACYADIDPDFDDSFQNGVHPLFYRPGQTKPAPDEWGSIGAWAWGLSRILDYVETAPEIDATRVAVMGHSRLGKTALWAGATDPRFSIVISNNSGAGGAALSRRIFGETVAHLNRSFPHWFCDNFNAYDNREDRLPVDQHELIALIAPRPVLISSAEEDHWADPKGEFLAARGADPVYRLLGTDGLAISSWPAPAVDSLVNSTIGYRIRPGKHDVTPDDWDAYMAFAEHHWRGNRQ